MPSQRLLVATLPFLAASAAVFAVGDLNPPAGAVAATGKRLTEIEPRIPISATTTPGDLDSVFRIISPGSYYLTGNVNAAFGKFGIEIGTSDVTLDLGGYVVSGIGSSPGFDGIRASATGVANITIRNGTVSDWGGHGIDLAALASNGGLIENVTLRSNLESGLVTGLGYSVQSCVSQSNSLLGIDAGNGSNVSKCITRQNGTLGLRIGDGAAATDCTSVSNGTVGISAGFDSRVERCSATANAGSGISARYSIVSGCTANLNIGNGIEVSSACLVVGNTCSSNGASGGNAAGILVSSLDNRIEGNNCTDSDRGIDVNGAGNIIVRNTCSGNTTNWDIAANNVFGPIVDRSAPASAAVLGNSAPSSLGSTDANANFTY